jgi:putative SOS response-associated peptidase YedK
MLERRCLIPCSWYFEWETRDGQQSLLDDPLSLQIRAAGENVQRKAKSRQKIKYAIRPKAPGVIFLAGIYRYEENQRLPVLSVLTREPAPEIAFIHDRMPVIFSEAHYGAWLDRNADPSAVLALCEKEMTCRAA